MKPVRGNGTVFKGLAWFFTIFMICAIGYAGWQAVSIGIFSSLQLILGAILSAILFVLLVWGLFSHLHAAWRIVIMILCAALGCGCILGGYYLSETSAFFSAIGGTSSPSKDEDGNEELLSEADVLGEQMAMTLTTYAMTPTGYTRPSDLSGKTIGVASALDRKGTSGALEQLEKEGMRNAQTEEFSDAFSLVDALYNESVDAIILPEEFHGDLLDAANDINKYNALTTFTNTVDQYIYYTDVPDEMKNPADPVRDTAKDPFVVLISGSDSYGNLSTKSRSDVNMLAAVNPKTAQVLLVSLPRDAYMEVSCSKNETACAPVSGAMDKLTHTGIYGIGTTESSIEDFLGVEINYTARVNFSSLINIVDAIGGIDVTVEPGLEVERFYSNGTEGVHEGVNHLDGERALAFARERHAYIDGDNQRVKNQQIVMSALLHAMMSPAMIVKYPAFIRALSTAFSTNMPSSQIRDLIRLEVSSFPNWDIQSFALAGNSETAFCAALGSYASVSIIPEEQIEEAKKLIDDVTEGKSVHITQDSQEKDSSQDSSQDSRSEIPVYDDGGFDQIPYTELPGYYDPYQEYPVYQQPEPVLPSEDSSWNEPVYEQPELPEQQPELPEDPGLSGGEEGDFNPA